RRLRYAEQESSLCRLQHALLHHPQLDFQNLFQLCRTQRMEHHGLVNAVHEFRREFPLGGFRSSLLYFLVEPYLGLRALQRRKSQPAGHQLGDFHAAQVRGHENHRLRQIHSPVVAQRQSSLVQNPQQQLPQGIRSLLDLVKQQERNLQLLGVVLREGFLRDQRMRFAVPQISRRRPNQFRDFVRVLKFRAIHLDHRARISKQTLGGSFDDARLARARRPQEQQIPYRTPRRVQPG